MTKASRVDSLLTRAEELDFRRDIIECSPESFTGEQIIDLLHEQRRVYDAMDQRVRKDFASHDPVFRDRILDSLDGAVGHVRSWWEGYLTGTVGN